MNDPAMGSYSLSFEGDAHAPETSFDAVDHFPPYSGPCPACLSLSRIAAALAHPSDSLVYIMLSELTFCVLGDEAVLLCWLKFDLDWMSDHFHFVCLHSTGKYVGSRPIKLRKSNWKNRNIDEVKKRQKEKDVLLGKRR
jgi:hypothetical protein